MNVTEIRELVNQRLEHAIKEMEEAEERQREAWRIVYKAEEATPFIQELFDHAEAEARKADDKFFELDDFVACYEELYRTLENLEELEKSSKIAKELGLEL